MEKNLEDMDLKELLEIGIRSEIEAQKVYEEAAGKKGLPKILTDKLKFLKGEEESHEEFLRDKFDELFPSEEPELFEESFKPAPKPSEGKSDVAETRAALKTYEKWFKIVNIRDIKEMELTKIFEQAKQSEKESMEFYNDLKEKFEDEEMMKTAEMLAHMEKGHYDTLEHELEGLRKGLISSVEGR